MPPKRATRWSFLRPWVRALAPWLEYREWPDIEKHSLRSRLRALRVYLTKPEEIEETPRETAARLVVLREALELVGLALHYDRDAWGEFEFLTNKPVGYKHWRQFGDESDLEPRFELAFDVAHEDQVFEMWWEVNEADVFAWDMELCKKMLELPAQDLTVEYHAAKTQLETLVGRAYDDSYKLEIQFTFMPPRQPTTHYVGKVHRFIQAVDSPTSHCRRVFKLSLVHAYVHALPYTVEMAAFFEFLQSSSIQLAMASVGPRDRKADSDDVARVISATMAPQPTSVPPREPRMMVLHGSDAHLLELVCEALACGSRTDHLVLEDAFRDVPFVERHQAKMKWSLLGRALSEPLCTRPLKVLSLAAMMKLSTSDVETLKTEVLAPRETNVQMVTIVGGAVLRLPSNTETTVSDAPLTCEAVDTDSALDNEWTAVKVPDVGVCSAKSADIIDAFERHTKMVSKPALESLDVGCGFLDANAVLGLAEAFGSTLRQLSIHVAFDPKIEPDTWAMIVRQCVRLEALSITNATFNDLRVLQSLYEDNPHCPLTRISLTDTSTTQSSVSHFFHALSRPTHAVAQKLLQFRYLTTKVPNLRSNSNQPSPAIVKVLPAMLRSNKTLEFLEIGLVPKLYKAHELQLHAFHNELLGARPAGPVYREISLVAITEVWGE